MIIKVPKLICQNGNTTSENSSTLFQKPIQKNQNGKYTVKFYLSKSDMASDKKCYRTYYLEKGDIVSAPEIPHKKGAHFDGWEDANDYIADFSIPITQDITYYAVWK